jgi:hypothetical protein
MKLTKIVVVLILLGLQANAVYTQIYNSKLVETYDGNYDGEKLQMVKMNRKGDRIKAKYFAAKYNGKDVYNRYLEWSKGKNIILVSSGTYMDDYGVPVGLTIDNGVVVSRSMAPFDGLVIVYATGGIAVTNLEKGDLKVHYTSTNTDYTFTDLQNNSTQRSRFIAWAEEEKATVFQTHLLIYTNTIGVYTPSIYSGNSAHKRERRFLIGVKDAENNVNHIIINLPEQNNTLYSGAKKAKEFLENNIDITNIVYMINLDTGYQDVLKFYNSYGTENSSVKGTADLPVAVNLLVYYYE